MGVKLSCHLFLPVPPIDRWFWAQNMDNISKIRCTTCISVPINIMSSENSKLGSRMPATLISHLLVAVKQLKRLDSTKASSRSIYRLNTSGLAGQPQRTPSCIGKSWAQVPLIYTDAFILVYIYIRHLSVDLSIFSSCIKTSKRFFRGILS